MLPYFPFGDRFNDKMGTRPISESEPLVEVDGHYQTETDLKRRLLGEYINYYYQAQPGHETAQWDVLALILQNLVRFSPGQFSLTTNGNRWQWHNALLNETTDFIFDDASTLPHDPLDWVGRQVQEDLVLLAGNDARLVAGQLCFGNGWCLDEKIGLPFWDIHAPITPIVEPMMQAAQTLMTRLPVGRPVWRLNWSVKVTDQLDMTNRHTPALDRLLADTLPTLTPATIGEKLFIRIERQTLTRLPRSGAVLFGIHTYQNLLAHEAANPERAAGMKRVFETTPAAMIAYKSMAGFLPTLLTYLEMQAKPAP